MKTRALLLPAFACLLVSCQSGQPRQTTKGPTLVWADEFDTAGRPDPTKWAYDVGGHGWGNQELQFYTENVPRNARVENGHLIIEAHREPVQTNNYSSAKLVTRGKASWTYGRLEVRARLPQGRGTWPAIWMLADVPQLKWPDDGEIDIMEHVGHDQGVVHGTVHTKAYHHSIGTQKGGQTRDAAVSSEFRTYRIDWSPQQIEWYIDGKKYYTFANEQKTKAEWPFDRPFYLILNLAIGGAWGGQKGVDDSQLPQRLEVDWVRVYKP
ncbi:MAG: glycoside hydrolase family 16 protein [Bernardetiaceae bacterium]|nr:glycoside hydrolase family 16 protein [Bernardetiaceae bacterium]